MSCACAYSLLVHLCIVSICAISHLLWNVLIASGAMNEPVMADTLPFTTESSHWIVTMSIMILPTCIAQTDGCAVYYTHQRPNVGLHVNGVHVIYCHIVPWTWRLENFHLLSLHVLNPKYE